ncbi:uncharacterized protein PITG_02062 [Phytophthora infestans T30-4]|uniref:Uncharacterized protein n=1 Tax=Phytophthora infestans (strain T30-4) TaxID=403677 RepID=D0MUS5_PHYIT|nr:uncharacterized protein PITG_02062 [Phytophthora infestans T30-4]EEY61722.1 conserved hypothetical protein [Phytophthora infestans T30-4]|eukprot:XP_002908639.1 conserved hypothetical protein [Phytophthora infestans T30-4]
MPPEESRRRRRKERGGFSSPLGRIPSKAKSRLARESSFARRGARRRPAAKNQVITDVGFRTEKPERFSRDLESSRGGRGNRGGRGARGNDRTGGRGARGANVPNVTDMSAFPSLG